jgi:hypothetical protein
LHSPAHELTAVVAELRRLSARVADAAVVARGLADAVHWQSKAATAFYDSATVWAGGVSALGNLAEAARHDAQRAADAAAYAQSLSTGRVGEFR